MSANKHVVIAKGDKRFDEHGELRCLAYEEGYVMCRRPKCAPFIMTASKWLLLSANKAGEEKNE